MSVSNVRETSKTLGSALSVSADFSRDQMVVGLNCAESWNFWKSESSKEVWTDENTGKVVRETIEATVTLVSATLETKCLKSPPDNHIVFTVRLTAIHDPSTDK